VRKNHTIAYLYRSFVILSSNYFELSSLFLRFRYSRIYSARSRPVLVSFLGLSLTPEALLFRLASLMYALRASACSGVSSLIGLRGIILTESNSFCAQQYIRD
jgi:hypothetical protein